MIGKDDCTQSNETISCLAFEESKKESVLRIRMRDVLLTIDFPGKP